MPFAASANPPLAAGRYVLVSVLSGHCVDAVPGTADGGKVQQALCNNGANQTFDVTLDADRGYKFLIVGTGRALDLNGGSTADGAVIQQWSDNSSIAQRFLLRRSQGNRYSLVNAGSNKCVIIAGSSTAAGAGLQQATCDGQPAQQFLLYPQSGTSRGALALGQYSLRPVHSGLCLEIEGASAAAGAKAQQGTCTNENHQRFEVLPAANGSYQLQSLHSGLTLDVTAESTASGALLQQWAYAGGAHQRFTASAVGDAYLLKAVHSGKCMDVKDISTQVGGGIHQWDCSGNGQPNQQWRLVPASEPPPPPTPSGPPLRLPLELLSDGSPLAPKIAEASLQVDASRLSSVSQLWWQCHRCAFFGAPEFEATSQPPVKIKASVRVLGGVSPSQAGNIPWVDITDATVKLADAERVQGGLTHGGFYTTRMSLVLDAAAKARLVAAPQSNLIQFRFNGTDGESNGYRVLALQLQDAQGTLQSSNPSQYADILAEKQAGRTWSADVTAGEALWHGQGKLLKSSIVNRPIKAACASCHATDGRDLQYFNYSNNAIVQRSRFHGLTEAQGQQIAAYLRYGQRNVPHVAQAAPWNPPYQPGPGLDGKPIIEWAAGAGLSAVLESPALAVKALFGKPLDGQPLNLSQADIDAVMNANATLNAREGAMPLQYPDWNAWLPTLHPLDVWPTGADSRGSFETGAQWTQGNRHDPLASARRIDTWLKAHLNPNGQYGDWSHLTPAERNQIQGYFQSSGWEAYNFLGGGRGNHVAKSGEYGAQAGARLLAQRASSSTTSGDPGSFTVNAFIERAVMSMLHWNAIKQWEWAHTYGLEGNQQWFIGAFDSATQTWKGRGEVRGWPFNTVSVFFLAPHMLYQADETASGQVTREWYLAWERSNTVGSYYRTNIWYQMQVTINPGAQSDWVNFSVDWPYLTGFDEVLADAVGTSTPAHANAAFLSHIRLLQARIKGAQFVNNDIPLYVATDTGNLINNRGRFSRAQAMKHLTPVNFIDRATTQGTSRSRFGQLDQLQPGLHLKVVNGAMNQFNILFTGTAPEKWRRCDPANMDLGESEPYAGFSFCVDATKKPLAQPSSGNYVMNVVNGRATAEQLHQYGLWKVAQMGGEPQRLEQWRAWTQRLWP
ncbi:RICIN domain-containing protein [Stigmatella erecta]|nr:RICIN domain-containing protein [Stigmatella erecta]